MQVIRIEGGATVADLMFELRKLPPDLPVWMSKDEEGNGFAPLAEFGPAKVGKPERDWMWSQDLYEPDDKRAPKKAIDVLLLWPGA